MDTKKTTQLTDKHEANIDYEEYNQEEQMDIDSNTEEEDQ